MPRGTAGDETNVQCMHAAWIMEAICAGERIGLGSESRDETGRDETFTAGTSVYDLHGSKAEENCLGRVSLSGFTHP